jgi:anthranilate/para-aminobenzoate synthase component II
MKAGIKLYNNILYELDMLTQVKSFINQHPLDTHFEIKSFIVFNFPYMNKDQNLVLYGTNQSFYYRMMKQLNVNNFHHALNVAYSLFTLSIEGSFYLVDQLLDIQNKTIGILLDRNSCNCDNNSLEMKNIKGYKKVYLYYDMLINDLDLILHSIDLLIIQGWSNNNLEQHKHLMLHIYHTKIVNQNKPLPIIGICFGMQLIVHSLEPTIKLETSDSIDYYTDLSNKNKGCLSNLNINHTYHNHQYGYNLNRFHGKNFNVIHSYNDRSNQCYVATIEHNKYPIYGFAWHPFSKMSNGYTENLKFLKNLFYK